jgi:folate-binding protein YgfZ
VFGPDALTFLEGLLTQHVELPAGSVSRSFLLEPRGKVRAMMWVCVGEDEALLISQQAELLAETLSMYRIRVKAEIVLTELIPMLEVGSDFGQSWTGDSASFIANAGHYRFSAGHPANATMTEEQFKLARILLGEPEIGRDLDDKSMVHETSLVARSVAFDKGCYLGQELVSRIETRGRSNQRTVQVRGSGVAPEAGAAVILGEKVVGTLTSVVEVNDAFVGLAMVRREAGHGDEVHIGSAPATVRELPTDTAGDGFDA